MFRWWTVTAVCESTRRPTDEFVHARLQGSNDASPQCRCRRLRLPRTKNFLVRCRVGEDFLVCHMLLVVSAVRVFLLSSFLIHCKLFICYFLQMAVVISSCALCVASNSTKVEAAFHSLFRRSPSLGSFSPHLVYPTRQILSFVYDCVCIIGSNV